MSSITTINHNTKALPAAFANAKLAQVFQGQQFEKASDGIEGSYGVLKYPGKVWKLSYRGEIKPILRPDDGTPRATVDVIFVRSGAHKAKTYYPGGFQEGARDKPTCWSNDGQKPDASVPEKQAVLCKLCPKDVFGSKITPDGKKAKACADHKRTAIILDPKIAMDVLGVPLDEPILLRIPAASLNDFAAFGDRMETQGFPLPSFLAKIGFDFTKNYPKLTFEEIRPLDEAEGAIAMALRDDPTAVRIISDMSTDSSPDENVGSNGSNAGQSIPMTANGPYGAAGHLQQAVQNSAPAPSQLPGSAQMQAATQGTVVSMPQRQTPQEQAAQMQPVSQQAKPETNTVSSELEAEIDAQIAKMMQ